MDETRVIISTPFYTAYQSPNNRVAIVPSSEITATDAELSRHPSTAARQEDTEVNHLEVADEEAKADWKKKLGVLVAKNLIKAAVETDGKTWTGNVARSTLLSFPRNYELFVKKKGDRHVPRKDYYLYGSQHVRTFRSPLEFVPHLIWLFQGQPLKTDGDPDCSCKYCNSGATQSEIHKRLLPHAGPSRVRMPVLPDGPKKSKGAAISVPYKDYTKLNKPS
ncbi:hypothetical protein PHLCEN_2v6019 [Hermanssonia centrifuga]|uniref:Cryptic loci regulator 2 N-terminal domain-containing protein n=1 Tax=Hermanssonia centrifuga TaxID=98765 RepID=A0A2R6P0M7_9APHY|nr:hypothetical protein PHLCEN_2v6019 [Hermanssonia centrifuga]